MNRFWIVIAVLISVNLTTPDPVNADGALKYVKISKGINPKRRLGIPGTIERGYSWKFENQHYTVLIAVDSKWYNKNRYQPPKRSNFRNFPPMVAEGTSALQDLVREFNRVMPSTWSSERTANFVLAFVQSLPYTSDGVTTGYEEFYRYVTETLVEGGGDCEDTSVLFASILSGLNFEVALILLPGYLATPGHLAVGVKGNFRGIFFPYENNNYYYCETTVTGSKLGQGPEGYERKMAIIMPITPAPVAPKQVMPKVNPPKPKPPKPPGPHRTLEKGIKLYEQARYNEAIKSLRSSLRRLGDSEGQAQAYLYLGCSKWGFGEANDKVKDQFREALRHNPDQKLPPRIGEDHPVFGELFEEVRKELTGKLTVTSLQPQTEIWIDGNGIDRKMLGTGTVSRRLLEGNYTVEGIYEGGSKKKTVKIEPNHHKELDLEIPPIVKHDAPLRTSVGKIIPLTLDLISYESPEQVKIYYKIYDRNSNELEQDNKKMRLWDEQPASSTWTYKVNLPSQKYVGSIKYYIEVEYEDRLTVRHPETRYRYYRIAIIDGKRPTIDLLDPIEIAKANQRITITAKVTDNTFVQWVRLSYGFSRFSNSEPSHYYQKELTKTASSRYTGHIPPQSKTGYIWYYLTATDEAGNERESKKRHLEIKSAEKPRIVEPSDGPHTPTVPDAPTIHQEIWANHAWSSVLKDGASASGGNMFRLAYQRESKTHQTLGAQLDFAYQNPENARVTVQWESALAKSPVAFTLLGGVARYRSSDSNPTHITPILGAGLKLYPLDRITIDATSSIKLRSVFDTTHLYHYEMGVRVNITHRLNLRIGYGQWYLGNQNITNMQVGIGVTF